MNDSTAVPLNYLAQFLKTNNLLLQQLIDALPIPIFGKDIAGNYIGGNQSFEAFIKLTRDQFIGRNANELFDSALANTYNQADQELFASDNIQVYEAQFQTTQGDIRYVKFHKRCFYDENAKVAGLIGAIFDITEQKNLEMSLQQLASYDSLTGLYNRREGLSQAEILNKNWQRTGKPFSLLVIDIDYFKNINDNHGHYIGDKAICHISQILQDGQRPNDIVARHGGEEFVIWLPNTDLAQAQQVAQRYCQTIAKSQLVIDNDEGGQLILNMTVSIGLATSQGQSMAEIFKTADQALYHAKSAGRNRVEIPQIKAL